MTNYNLADAEADLPRLIEEALGGEDVVITRLGEPVVALKSMLSSSKNAAGGSYTWLRARRGARRSVGLSSVDILNRMYDETAV